MQLEQGCNKSCCVTSSQQTASHADPSGDGRDKVIKLETVLDVKPRHPIPEFNCSANKEYTEYAQSHSIHSCAHARGHKHLPLRRTGDRGIESVHIRRGNRACGESGAVGATGGELVMCSREEQLSVWFSHPHGERTQLQGWNKKTTSNTSYRRSESDHSSGRISKLTESVTDGDIT